MTGYVTNFIKNWRKTDIGRYIQILISQKITYLTKEFDIEHIIPQASLFDDSLSNKNFRIKECQYRKR